jgi:hypothetical protein
MQDNNVVCYKSRKLKEHEENYVTNDLELVAVVHALKMWRNYLMCKGFEIIIDHNVLKYLFEQSNLNSRNTRWLEFLCELEFANQIQRRECLTPLLKLNTTFK